MKEKGNVAYRCDILIDQKRYIGSDPVGYKCFKEARWEHPESGLLMCDDCKEMLRTEPGRLTFPPFGGKERQTEMLLKFIEHLKAKE